MCTVTAGLHTFIILSRPFSRLVVFFCVQVSSDRPKDRLFSLVSTQQKTGRSRNAHRLKITISSVKEGTDFRGGDDARNLSNYRGTRVRTTVFIFMDTEESEKKEDDEKRRTRRSSRTHTLIILRK